MKVFCHLPTTPLTVRNEVSVAVSASQMEFLTFGAESELLDQVSALPASSAGCLIVDESCRELVARFTHLRPTSPVIVLVKTGQPRVAELLQPNSLVTSLIAYRNDDIDRGDLVTMFMKLRSGELFGIERHLRVSTPLYEREIRTNVDKGAVIREVGSFVRDLGRYISGERFEIYSERCESIVDELVLNAIFDANPRLAGVARGNPFSLEKHEMVKVSWGFDGAQFAVSVADTAGSLERQTVMNYLFKSGPKGPVGLRRSGGFGLQIVYEKLQEMIINVDPGRKTEIICLTRFDKRLRDADRRPRTFHFWTKRAG